MSPSDRSQTMVKWSMTQNDLLLVKEKILPLVIRVKNKDLKFSLVDELGGCIL